MAIGRKESDLKQPSQRTRRYRWDRAGKRVVAAHVATEAVKELRILGEQQHMTTDALMHEAIALLFRKHNRPVPPAIFRKLRELGIEC
jgi:hypothetical protein